MKTFTVWLCKESNNKAPEYVFVDKDYTFAGELDASSPKEVVKYIAYTNPKDSELLDHKTLRTGDVLEDEVGNGFILTPFGVWATVKILRTGHDIVDE